MTASTLVGWDLLAARLRAAKNTTSDSNIWAPLKYPRFVLFFVCTLFGSLASRINEVALVWLMTGLTRSPLMVSLVTTALSLPAFLLALPAGALGDMFDRRRLMLIAESFFVVNLSVLAMLTLGGLATPAILLTSAMLTGFLATIIVTSNDAILPQIVERRDFSAAIALTGARYQLSQAIGPILGGILISVASLGHTFLFCAMAPFAMMLFLWSWHTPPSLKAPATDPIGHALRLGLRYVRYAPQLVTVLVRVVAFLGVGSAMWALLPVYVRHHRDMNALEYGLLFGTFGIGGILGNTVAYRLTRATSDETVLAGSTVAFAFSLLLVTQMATLNEMAATLFFAGLSWAGAMLSLKTAIQLAAPDWIRARVSSIYVLTLHGAAAIGSAIWGLVANYYGTPMTLRYAAVAMVATSALALRYRLSAVSAVTLDHMVPGIAPLELPATTVGDVPLMITLQYEIELHRAGEFEHLMHQIGSIRRRVGATFWGLFVDPSTPHKYEEYFMVDSALDAARMHDRLTDPERETMTLAHSFHTCGERPTTHHHRFIC